MKALAAALNSSSSPVARGRTPTVSLSYSLFVARPNLDEAVFKLFLEDRLQSASLSPASYFPSFTGKRASA
jgi:hypothetical protein